MEFTGRITSDAKISTVKGDKEVVNFTVAVNDRYRPKGSTETKEFVTFYNVAWWIGTNVAKILTKGAIVTVIGRLSVNAYIDWQGNAKGSINCHASQIKLIQSKKTENKTEPHPSEITEPAEDLPL